MKYLKIEQKSPEWWAYKVGRVSGTRTGQLISTRENSLIDEMLDEMLDGFVKPNDFQTDEMLFGIENEGRRRYNGSRILTSVDKKSPASKAVG